MSALSGLFHGAEPEIAEIGGVKLRFVRSEKTAAAPILLTSPWPESICAFHAIWGALLGFRPVVALDLPGFGRSDYRADLMSPAAMGGFLIQFANALGISKMHAVGPDVGTSAMLFAAVAAPERFESIIVGSGGASMSLLGEPLRKIVLSSPEAFAGEEGGGRAVEIIRQRMRSRPPEAAIEDFRAASQGQRWNNAANYVRAYSGDLPKLEKILPGIRTPVCIISGADDPIVPPENGAFLAEHLPNAVAHVLHTGHFTWEDDPETYVEIVKNWVGAHAGMA